VSELDIAAAVLAAETRIRAHIRQTPLERSNYLSDLAEADVYLKLESAQITGSFKLRGAMNKMLALSDEERERGVLTASSGNHGAACAYLMTRFGIRGTIYLPESVAPAKLEAIQSFGADTELVPGDGIEAEKLARRLAAENGRTYVSPYNDPLIVAGQGTIGLELRRQLETLDTVLIPVGGGGLAAGVAGYLKSVDAAIDIIGCQPENSRVMYESLRAGEVLDRESQPTLSDGTAGGVDADSITFEMCRDLIDDWALLSEDEIAGAILLALGKQHLMIEGAGALSIAALVRNPERFAGQTVVLIVSGSKLGMDTLRELLARN
jgi:threonine dehydratase